MPWCTFAKFKITEIPDLKKSPEILNCKKNEHLSIKNVNWALRSDVPIYKLRPDQLKRYKELMKEEELEKTLRKYQELCDGKKSCSIVNVKSGVSSKKSLLYLVISFECFDIGACPNKMFLEKHIAPPSNGQMSLAKIAKQVEQKRKDKGWAQSTIMTFFVKAVNMEYERIQNNKICEFKTPAHKYECEKEESGWICYDRGEEKARHRIDNGHYIPNANAMIF